MTTTPEKNSPQVQLPGQAAAPAGACDMSGMYLMHHGFRRDLRDFAEATRTTTADDRAWGAIAERWDHFARLLHEHHGVEDRVLWPLLLERVDAAGDTLGREVLDAMEAEHALIDPLLDRVRALLDDIVARGDEAARAELEGVIDQAHTVLDDHLAHEEREAVPLVQTYVPVEEWDALERKEFRGRPSLKELRFQLPWMVHEVPDEVVRPLVKAGGPPFALILKMSRRSFLRQQHAAFRHQAGAA